MKLKFILIVLLAVIAFLLGTQRATNNIVRAQACGTPPGPCCTSGTACFSGVCSFGFCVIPSNTPIPPTPSCGNQDNFCCPNGTCNGLNLTCTGGFCRDLSNPPPTSTPALTSCQHNVWGGCSGTTESCVTQNFALCASGDCSCYSNICDDGSTRQCGAVATNTPNPVPTGNPPQCSGGVTIDGLSPNAGEYNVSQGQTITLRANTVTDPDGSTDLKEMRFAYKPTTVNACPPNLELILLDLDTDPTNGFTSSLDTTNLVPGTSYDVWGTPRDFNFNGCSGNPSANANNQYCGVNFGCANCRTVINVLAVTPTPDTCPRGTLGNLNCSPNGCIDIIDFNSFEGNFGKVPTIIPGNHSPNLVNDQSTVIDTADYEILRQNYNTCTP